MTSGKALIFSAPSGSGKTTIVKHLLSKNKRLGFSISATTRQKRSGETNGRDYYFLDREEFKKKIDQGEFVEWEEVYDGLYYGTMKEEVERLWKEGKHVVFDVDVVGGLNLKAYFGERGLAVFVKAPGLDAIRSRLQARQTESEESLKKRMEKVKFEMGFEDKFDISLVNDDLEKTLSNSEKIVDSFINNK